MFLLLLCVPTERIRPEVEVNAQIEGGLAAEVNSIVLDTLEHLVQVSVSFLFNPFTLKI